MPVISVIVPVYKVEQYLPECIDSILAQTFTDFELILVDDGSPDNCGKICDEYQKKDDRIVVIHKENGGLSDARNKGIDIARGEYLTFIDSDDLVHIEYLSILFSLIKKYSADISMCSMESFTGGGCVLNNISNLSTDTAVFSGRDACAEIFNMNPSLVTVMAWGKLYRSNIFLDLRYPFKRLHEDEGTTPIALYNADTAVCTGAKLYKYRNRSDSIMNRPFNPRRFDAVYCIQLCVDYFREKDDYELAALADTYKSVVHSKLIIEAIAKDSKDAIPDEYCMSERKALKTLRDNCSDDRYCWHLAKIHPGWLKPHAYLRKIKKIFGIKCS